MHGLGTYRLRETLSSGLAVIRSQYTFVAPDRMQSVVGGKSEAIWVGTTRHRRDQPGASWEVQKGGPSIPVPSFIWDYFKPYRDIRVLGREQVDGMQTAIVSFFGQTGGTPSGSGCGSIRMAWCDWPRCALRGISWTTATTTSMSRSTSSRPRDDGPVCS
jgi:hypothetical protein